MKLLLFLLLVRCLPLYSQDYSYVHYDTKNGLIGNNIYDAVQDKEGFIWFATETGVSRFDGTKFTNFTTATGLPDNEIINLFVDSKNRVWMIPFKNKICYYKEGKISTSENDSFLRSINLKSNITSISEDRNGNIALTEMTKINLLSTSGKTKEIVSINKRNIYINNSGIDTAGNFQFLLHDGFSANTLGIYSVNANGELVLSKRVNLKSTNESFYLKKAKINGNTFFQYGYDGSGNTRIILSAIVEDKYFDVVINEELEINTVSFAKDSTVKINTKNGTIKFNFIQNKVRESFLPSENVSSSFMDLEQNLWFTTLGNGVFMMPNSYVKTFYFQDKNRTKAQLESTLFDNKFILTGSGEKNLYVVDTAENNHVRQIPLDKNATGKIIKITKLNSTFYFLAEHGLFSSVTPFSKIKTEISGIQYSFKDMDINKDGAIYISTHSEVISNTSEKAYSQNQGIFSQRSTAISYSDTGLYVGTITGLHFVNSKTNSSIYLGKTDALLGNRITKLLSFLGYLIIGTNDNGVIIFDGKRVIRKISTEDGLSGNIIRCFSSAGNFLWVGTDKGLDKIDMSSPGFPVVANYSSLDGLANSLINGVWVENNMVFVATSSGLSYFDETKMTRESICKLIVTDIVVKDRHLQARDSILKIPNSENSIFVEFVGISYKSVGNIKYYYRLLPQADTTWKETKTPSLQYLSLASGNYQLQIKAVNAFGKESNISVVKFIIESKLTEKTWFKLVAAVITFALIGFLFRLRLQQLRKKEAFKASLNKRMADLEQLALKSQMNPHFIFNCLNSIQQYVIEKDVNGANKFIANFSKLIRQTLDNSGKTQISLAEEENFILSYLQLEKIRFENKFEYTVQIDKTLNKNEVYLPPMLLQPYIENSIRHGIRLKKDNSGLIQVAVKAEHEYLVITIIDNGVGRKEAAEYKSKQHIQYQSKGMYLMERRIELFNQNQSKKIEIEITDTAGSDNSAGGTCVTIKFPIIKEVNTLR